LGKSRPGRQKHGYADENAFAQQSHLATAPIFFGLALQRWRFPVFDLHPIR
jgi:hypothetical protein